MESKISVANKGGDNLYINFSNVTKFQPPQAQEFYFCKYLVFGLQALNNLAQWQRPERTVPWVKLRNTICALKGQYIGKLL